MSFGTLSRRTHVSIAFCTHNSQSQYAICDDSPRPVCHPQSLKVVFFFPFWCFSSSLSLDHSSPFAYSVFLVCISVPVGVCLSVPIPSFDFLSQSVFFSVILAACSSVCVFVFRHSSEVLSAPSDGSLSQLLDGRARTMEDVLPLLELWLARAQEPVQLKV